MTIEAVLFDADGVIQSSPPDWRSKVAGLCGSAGEAEENRTDEFLEDLFAAERPCLTGEGDFASVIVEVLDRWNSESSLEEALAIWQLIEPHQDLLAIVDRLRGQQIVTGLATNQQPVRARYMTDNLKYGERFDELLFSCRIGHAKPGSAYFLCCLEELGLPGDRVLFIDDHSRNVEAARRCGLRAEVFETSMGEMAMIQLLTAHGVALDGS